VTVELAQTIWMGIGLYLAIGLFIAIAYALFAAARIDHAAEGAPLQFRLIIVPGVIGLWPIMLLRFLSFRRINTPIENHDRTAS
jgi:nitrogen fixation/metabolism regulation signal transduction histidine kinase